MSPFKRSGDDQPQQHPLRPGPAELTAGPEGLLSDMGAGATTGKPADTANRQGTMEQRMDMMQSMTQMMMDRMQSVPVTK